jgi:prepilin-type N-terminal cleavage/methylation domain-containing protein
MMLKTMRYRQANELGFTLLEMVIAVTLVAMMAVALWGIFRLSINSWKRGTDAIDVNQRNRSILDLVKKQMSSIYGTFTPIDPQNPVQPYPIFTGGENSVQFVSLCSLRFNDNPGLTFVSYDVDQDRQGNYALTERETRYLGDNPGRDSIFDRKEDTSVTIFDNLTSFSFEYFDPGTRELPAQWVRGWDSRDAGRMPAAISMTMIAKDPKGGTFSRFMVMPIPAKPYDPRQNFINPFDPRRGY